MESTSENILVAEDDENLRSLYEEELRDEGYQVVSALFCPNRSSQAEGLQDREEGPAKKSGL